MKLVDAAICELPLHVAGLPESTNRSLLVAGGLALVLSRCSSDDVGHVNARELYRLLRSDLKGFREDLRERRFVVERDA